MAALLPPWYITKDRRTKERMNTEAIREQGNIKTEEKWVMGMYLGTTTHFYNADGSERSCVTIWNDGTVTRKPGRPCCCPAN